MKNQILLPIAAMLIGSPVLAGCGAAAAIAGSNDTSLHLSTSALSFNGASGNVSSQPITMTATGSKSVTITSASFSNGTFSAPLPNIPITIPRGQSFTGQISAHPQSTDQTGKLTIVSNVGTYVVSLSETAQALAAPTSHEVSLTWQAPAGSSDAVDSYQVERAVAGSTSYSVVGTATGASTSFTDTSVSSGKSYTYEIRSVDANGNTSSPSNAVTLSIP